MLSTERERELADFIVFNKRDIAKTLAPKLEAHWAFLPYWDKEEKKQAKQLFRVDLILALREFLVTSYTATTIEALTLITPEFVYRITGKFFLTKENYK